MKKSFLGSSVLLSILLVAACSPNSKQIDNVVSVICHERGSHCTLFIKHWYSETLETRAYCDVHTVAVVDAPPQRKMWAKVGENRLEVHVHTKKDIEDSDIQEIIQ